MFIRAKGETSVKDVKPPQPPLQSGFYVRKAVPIPDSARSGLWMVARTRTFGVHLREVCWRPISDTGKRFVRVRIPGESGRFRRAVQTQQIQVHTSRASDFDVEFGH